MGVNNNTKILSLDEKITFFMELLLKISSKSLQIVFRLPGFHAHHSGDNTIHEINNIFKKYKNNKALKLNFIILDWSSVIEKRSFNNERIHGDIKAHYGLEARLLFCQQLLH